MTSGSEEPLNRSDDKQCISTVSLLYPNDTRSLRTLLSLLTSGVELQENLDIRFDNRAVANHNTFCCFIE